MRWPDNRTCSRELKDSDVGHPYSERRQLGKTWVRTLSGAMYYHRCRGDNRLRCTVCAPSGSRSVPSRMEVAQVAPGIGIATPGALPPSYTYCIVLEELLRNGTGRITLAAGTSATNHVATSRLASGYPVPNYRGRL